MNCIHPRNESPFVYYADRTPVKFYFRRQPIKVFLQSVLLGHLQQIDNMLRNCDLNFLFLLRFSLFVSGFPFLILVLTNFRIHVYLLGGESGSPRFTEESTGSNEHPFTGPPNSSIVVRHVLLPTSHSFAVPSFDTETIFLPRSIILVSVTPIRENVLLIEPRYIQHLSQMMFVI